MNFFTIIRTFCTGLSFLFLCLTGANAQLKINAGYDIGYTSASTANQILDNFNAANPDAISSFGGFGISNGFLVGLRYELDFLGVEASWVFRFDDEKTVLTETNSVTTSIDLLGRFQTFSFGLDNQFDWFSYGGSVDFNLNNINVRFDEEDNTLSYLNDRNFSSTIYLCLLYTSPSPRDGLLSRMPSSA